MKKLTALIIVCMLCLGTAAFAAEWPEGTSPAQPYRGKAKVDLNQTMGYLLMYPNGRIEKLRADTFCDVLEIYLPRDDIGLGEGALHLYHKPEEGDAVEVATVSFADGNSVEVRPLEEAELNNLMWGSGVCVDVHLPESLRLNDQGYYALMDEGCFQAADGAVKSIPVTNSDAWRPVAVGDYGVGSLRYTAPLPEDAAEDAEPEVHAVPQEGDAILFDLTLGGYAKMAVLYTENDSAYFENVQFTESCAVAGSVVSADLDWGIIFLDEENRVLEDLKLKTANAAQ